MASGNDMKAHQSTYDGFIKAATVGTVVCALVVMVVIGLIVS